MPPKAASSDWSSAPRAIYCFGAASVRAAASYRGCSCEQLAAIAISVTNVSTETACPDAKMPTLKALREFLGCVIHSYDCGHNVAVYSKSCSADKRLYAADFSGR